MKKRFVLIICLTTLIGLLLSNCKKSSNSTNSTQTYTPSCSGTKSFKTDVLPLFQSYCVGCHSNYSTYAQISASASSIRTVIMNASMPKNTTLTSGQKDNIICWIDAGAANN